MYSITHISFVFLQEKRSKTTMNTSKAKPYWIYIICGLIALFGLSKMSLVLLQYDVYQTDTPLAPIFMALFEAAGLFVILCYNPKRLLKGFQNKIILLFWILTGAIAILYGSPNKSNLVILLYVSLWIIGYFAMYYLGHIYKNILSKCSYFYLILAIPITLLFLYSSLQRGMQDLRITRMGNNAIFFVLCIFPWILLNRKKTVRTIGTLILLLLCILSLKRSAIIMAILISATFFYFEYLKRIKSVHTLVSTMAIAFGMVLLLLVANQRLDNMAMERMQSMSEDSGSGRTDRWATSLFLFSIEKNPIKIIFGHGFCAVEQAIGEESASAHNDFLEVLYDYGIIGLLLYLTIHICLIRRMIFLIRSKAFLRTSYTASYIIFFVMTMVSHLVIYPSYFLFLSTYWGATEWILANRTKRSPKAHTEQIAVESTIPQNATLNQ